MERKRGRAGGSKNERNEPLRNITGRGDAAGRADTKPSAALLLLKQSVPVHLYVCIYMFIWYEHVGYSPYENAKDRRLIWGRCATPCSACSTAKT